MKRILFFSFLLLLFGWTAQAQDRILTGIVKAEDGTTLPGVSIQIKGTSRGASTDSEGKFQIALPSSQVSLVFSFVGFESQTIAVGNQTSLTVTLKTDIGQLSEVVVTGYGVKQVKDLTGAISRINGSALASLPTSSFDKALAGKTAGVQVSSAGGLLGDGVAIRIRGINSISNSSLPLIVIDGVPSNTRENLNVFNSGNGTRFNPLALVNPNDIESLEVLKDAGAAVLYGSRAANGVILITTKKGKKGSSRISVDSKISWTQPSRYLKLLNGDEFNAIQNEKSTNRFGAASPNAIIAKDSDVDGDGKPDRVNWLDQIYRTGFSHDNSVSMSGGSDKATYYGSVRYSDQQGIANGNRLRTGSVRLNVDVTPKKWIKSGIQFSYNKAFNNGLLSDSYLAGITVAGLNALPTISPYNSTGGYNLTGTGLLGLGNNLTAVNGASSVQNNIYNPVAVVALQRNDNTAQNLVGNAYIDIKPIPSLTLTSKFGIDYLTNFEDQYSDPTIGGLGKSYNGLVQDNYLWRNLWTWQNYANFDHNFGNDHRVSAGVGVELQYTREQQIYTGGSNFADPFYKNILDGLYTSESGGTPLVLTGGDLISNGLRGFFGRLAYIYKDKYTIEGLYRSDEYSGFGTNSRVGKFPSVSAGWTISEEDFLKGQTHWLNYLKLRGSYGIVGNSRGIGSYAARTLYGGGQYAILNGFGLSQAGNPNLRWEASKKTNVALEARFLDDRIGLTAEYFYNNITDMVLAAPVLHTVGIPSSSITTNIGTMYNRGLEFTVNGSIIRTKDLNWNVTVNFTSLKNRVTQLTADGSDIISGTITRASVGRVLGVYNTLRWAGVDPATGNPSWLDKDGVRKFLDYTTSKWYTSDGAATTAIGGSDQVYIEGKSGLPTMYGGLTSNLTYKGFDFGFTFNYVGGFYIYNTTRSSMLGNYLNNNVAEIKERWTTPGQVTDVPRLWFANNTANQFSTRFLEKGDFLRLQDITLGYDLKRLLGEKVGVERIRLYGQVYNAFVLTKYKGADPEINSNRNNSNIAVGIDNRAVPQPRSFTLGLSVAF
jgi:TonB-linked SusC/RagA family outer membrane protein